MGDRSGLSIYHAGINKETEKRIPQFYYIKIKKDKNIVPFQK